MINQTQLKELLRYDPNTGVFTWLKRISIRINVGKQAGKVNAQGYRVIGVRGKTYRGARLAWLYMTGAWPDQVDHINHDRLDDRWCNLREVDHPTNHRNLSLFKNNTSGRCGVSFLPRDRLWLSGNQVKNRQFKHKSSAVAYRVMMEQAFGYHTNHGKPQHA